MPDNQTAIAQRRDLLVAWAFSAGLGLAIFAVCVFYVAMLVQHLFGA